MQGAGRAIGGASGVGVQRGPHLGALGARVALVTGAASGIGLACVHELLAQGASAMMVDRDAPALSRAVDDLAAEFGVQRVASTAADVADFAQMSAVVGATLERFGCIDILFNNAGIGCIGLTPNVSVEQWQRTIDVDLNAVFYACKLVIPLMRAQGAGAIVNTASISGLSGDYGFSAYSAAKAAVVNLTRTMALDHARDNIRVNAICPGLVHTPLIAGAIESARVGPHWIGVIPMGRPADAREIARAVRFMVSDDASYMTGEAMVLDGGLTAWTGQPDLLGLLGKRP